MAGTAGCSAVLVDQEPVEAVPTVNVDERGGAARAARHLLDLQHRRISILTIGLGPGTRLVADPRAEAVVGYAARQRLLGWLEVLETAGVRPLVAWRRLARHAGHSPAIRTWTKCGRTGCPSGTWRCSKSHRGSRRTRDVPSPVGTACCGRR